MDVVIYVNNTNVNILNARKTTVLSTYPCTLILYYYNTKDQNTK